MPSRDRRSARIAAGLCPSCGGPRGRRRGRSGQRCSTCQEAAAELGRDRAAGAVERPALRYFGGKWRLAPWILRHMPPHRCYVEPFAGAASVLMQKPRAPVECLNDAAGEVVNFFRVVRDHGDALIRVLADTPFALAEYRAAYDESTDPVERARRFFVRSWGGHSGGATGDGRRSRGWRRCADRDTAGNFVAAWRGLDAVRRRLRGVAIDQLDATDCMRRWDSRRTVHYVDPPYVHSTRRRRHPSDLVYGTHEMDDDAHRRLLDAIDDLEGTVLLSGYPCALYDDRLQAWTRVTTQAVIPGDTVTEALWINRPHASTRDGPQLRLALPAAGSKG